jgi:hypothetical protein
MEDVSLAISQWWSLVKVCGYLILVVPDEDLYKQGVWPSMLTQITNILFNIEDGLMVSSVWEYKRNANYAR